MMVCGVVALILSWASLGADLATAVLHFSAEHTPDVCERAMAEQISAVEDYLTCAVCLETFKEPLTLGCYHSFCSKCLNNYWDQNQTKACPVCRRKSSKDVIFVNFALKELCVSFTEKQKLSGRGGAGACRSHPEVPSLFCQDEVRLLCPVCEFSHHRDHTVVPLKRAETELKQQLLCQVQVLKRQRAEAQNLEQVYRDTQQHSHRQTELCERHIRAEFDRLHRFLKEEEELQLSVLREEQSRQAQSMDSELDRLRERLASLEQNIQELEKQLEKRAEDFILSYSPVQSPKEPLSPVRPGLLIDQAKVLGNLGFRVWRKMRSFVQFSPVVLDPNTAQPALRVSEDLTCVRLEDNLLELPENSERFSKRVLVLGSEGFRSGTHQWDVEVGDHPYWLIGVVKESVNRKADINFTLENGFLYLGFYNGKYSADKKSRTMKTRPQRIRVQLDFNRRTVSFYDSRDMTHIYTYNDTFTEKLFPFVAVGRSNADCQTKGLRICQVSPQVHV